MTMLSPEFHDLVQRMSEEQLSRAADVIRARLTSIGRAVTVGTRVEFTLRSGEVVRGTVTRRLQKNIQVKADVDCGARQWKVSPALLRRAAA